MDLVKTQHFFFFRNALKRPLIYIYFPKPEEQ